MALFHLLDWDLVICFWPFSQRFMQFFKGFYFSCIKGIRKNKDLAYKLIIFYSLTLSSFQIIYHKVRISRVFYYYFDPTTWQTGCLDKPFDKNLDQSQKPHLMQLEIFRRRFKIDYAQAFYDNSLCYLCKNKQQQTVRMQLIIDFIQVMPSVIEINQKKKVQPIPYADKFKNNFPEHFQDSEQLNCSEAGAGGMIGGNEDGQAIQLIRIRPSGKIQIDEKALQIISSYDLPIGFVALAGKYRTGKSFLLNKLLYLEGKGFRVDPSTAACTQGIWMWSKPVYNERQGNYLFFIDTQGSQSLNKDIENDTKIFVLATLISSFFMYNSVGSIDQKSINELNVVTKLSMNILTEQNIRNRQNQDILFRYMPKFLWVLRDFTLELRNAEGRKLTPKEYLEDALLDQNTLIRTNEDSKKIRRAIATHFKERDCVTLVRPAKQQRDLQRLDSLPEHMLRRQFIDGVNQIRDRIMKEAGPKMYEGTPLYGTSLASMIESYVQSMNTNGIPTIKTAWEHISEDEGAYAYNRALEVYNQTYSKYFNQDEPKGQQIHKLLISLRDEALTQFNKNISQPNQPYYNKLKQLLAEKEQTILSINRQLNDFRNVQILKECSSKLLQNIQSNAYEGNPSQIQRDIEDTVKEYKIRAKGESKGEILSQFLANMSPIILQLQKPKAPPENEALRVIQKNQYQQKLKLMEQKMKTLQNQLANTKQQNGRLNKSIIDSKKPNANPKDKKKESVGCCGTGSCSIM